MTVRILAPVLLSVSFAAACMQPPGMYQRAEVRMQGSVPCFSIPDTEETRRIAPVLSAISVDRYTGGAWETIWYWITPETPAFQLEPTECVPFGYEPPAGEFQAPTTPMKSGDRYHVAINSQIPNPSRRGDRTLGRMYSLDFCLQAQPDGTFAAVPVPRLMGEAQWQVCGP